MKMKILFTMMLLILSGCTTPFGNRMVGDKEGVWIVENKFFIISWNEYLFCKNNPQKEPYRVDAYCTYLKNLSSEDLKQLDQKSNNLK